jgi:phage shock protein E
MRVHVLLLSLPLALLPPTLLACSKTAPSTDSAATAATEGLPDRDPQLAKKLVDEGGVLIDVRSTEEWQEGHIDGAHHIPIDELDARLKEVESLTGGDKDKPIVTYCRSGGRAGRAKDKLLEAGYRKVTNAGGMSDWPKD